MPVPGCCEILRKFSRPALALAIVCLGAGCDHYPRDPHDSLDTAMKRGTLRVGASNNPPWVQGEAPAVPGGVEAQLVSEFADQLGLRVDWYWGNPESNVAALERFELDVLVGGFSQSNPLLKKMGLTVPYYTSRMMVALPDTADRVADLDGEQVAMLPASGVSEQLENRGAEVVLVEDLAAFDGPVAITAWQAESLGLQLTDIELSSRHHVLVVPPAENALLVRLETFLLQDAVPVTTHDWLVNGYR